MGSHVINAAKFLPLILLSAAIASSSGRVRADEPAAQPAPAKQSIVIRAASAGGIKAGEVLKLTDRGTERTTVAQLQAQTLPASKANPIDACVR